MFRSYFYKFSIFFLLFFLQKINAQKPNILLIISDDLNTNIEPYMGIRNHTPNLDRLASEGVKFTRAYCQYPLCGPSRASIMSGLYPESNGVLGNIYELGAYKSKTPSLSNHPSLAEFFRKNGYFTARVSKIFHMGVPGGIERGEDGNDVPESWDFSYNVMAPESMSSGKMELLTTSEKFNYGSKFSRIIIPDDQVAFQADYLATSQAIAILENRVGVIPESDTYEHRVKKDAPFFLAVGLIRPHVPYVAPENCYTPYPIEEMQIPEVTIGDNVPPQALRRQNGKRWGMNPIQKRMTIRGYMASVRFMDQQVGRLLNVLDSLNVRDNTIVVFISDHGYNLGEHDCWDKVSLWEGTVRVPLIISVPDYKKNHGDSSEIITELIDLYPTLAELCGFTEEQPKILQGKSLVNSLKKGLSDDKNYSAYTVSYNGKDASLRTERWRYTRWSEENSANWKEELYDHDNDPAEYRNLVDNPDYKEVLDRLRKRLDQSRRKANVKY